MKPRVSLPSRLFRNAYGSIALVAAVTAAVDIPVAYGVDTTPLRMLDPKLQVTTILSTGIAQPIGIVFLSADDYLVLQKASGQIKRVNGGIA